MTYTLNRTLRRSLSGLLLLALPILGYGQQEIKKEEQQEVSKPVEGVGDQNSEKNQTITDLPQNEANNVSQVSNTTTEIGYSGETNAPNAQSIPSTFALGEDLTGVLSNSVNLASGEIIFGIPLASIPGRNGLGAGLSLSYNSAGVSYQADIWNQEAPTSAVGLGWSFDYPKIVVDNKMSAARADDEFYIVENGQSIRLYNVAGAMGDVERTYKTERFTNWLIKYYEYQERWEITKEDGTLYIYGDRNNTTANAVQWVVHWGNWIGNSSKAEGQSRQGLVWNLAKVTNLWGDELNYRYRNVERYLNSSKQGQRHTEASYLDEVEDALGNRIKLVYGDKELPEYQEPHTEQAEYKNNLAGDAYQERVEKDFLDYLEVFVGNIKTYRVDLSYDFLGSDNLTKRQLSGLQQISYFDGVTESSPTMSFSYLQSGNRKGSLSQIVTLSGSVIDYNYATSALEIFDSEKQIEVSPASANYKEPGYWVGNDFVAVLWRDTNNGSWYKGSKASEVQIYNWDGKWTKTSYGNVLGNIHYHDVDEDKNSGTPEHDRVHCVKPVVGKDYFGVLRWNRVSSGYHYYTMHIWFRNSVTREWQYEAKSLRYQQDYGEISLYAGNNYIAVSEEQYGLDILDFNGISWTKERIERSVSTYWGFGTNNYLMYNRYRDRNNGDVFFDYKDEQGRWHHNQLPDNMRLYHTSWVTPNNWSGTNTHAGVHRWYQYDDGVSWSLNDYIYTWDENYNFDSNSRYYIDNSESESHPIEFYGESLVLQPHARHEQENIYSQLLRYDGVTWNRNFNNLRVNFDQHIGANYLGDHHQYLAFGEDRFYHWSKPYNGTIRFEEFDANALRWNSQVSFNTGNYSFVSSIGDYDIIQNDLYKRNSDGSYVDKGYINAGQRHLTGAGIYKYFITSKGSYASTSNVRLIKNDSFIYRSTPGFYTKGNSTGSGHRSYHDAQTSAHRRGNAMGGNILISFDEEYWEYANKMYFNYIGADTQISGKANIYPLSSVTINGIPTSYAYNGTNAQANPNGLGALFADVKVVPGSSNPNSRPQGYVQHYFYNSRSVSETGINLPEGAYDHKRFAGMPHTVITYNNNKEIGRQETVYNLVAGYKQRIRNENDEVIAQAYTVLPVKQRSTSEEGLVSEVNTIYHDQTFQPISVSTSYYNSQGIEETSVKEITYGWQKYTLLEDQNIFAPVVLERSRVGSTYTSSVAKKLKVWSGLNKWGTWKDYIWKGTGSSEFTAWASTTNPSNDWLLTNEVESRDQQGNPLEVKDVEGKSIAYTYRQGSYELATMEVYDAGKDEVLYTDFNRSGSTQWRERGVSYGHGQPFCRFTPSGSTPYPGAVTEMRFVADNWDFVFDFEFKFDSKNNNDFVGVQLNAQHEDQTQAEAGSGNLYVYANGTMSYEYRSTTGSSSGQISIPVNFDPLKWNSAKFYMHQGRLNLAVNGESVIYELPQGRGNFFGIFGNSHNGAIDNVRLYPSDAVASSQSFNYPYGYIESQAGDDGRSIRHLYNSKHQRVASIDHHGVPIATMAGYSSVKENGTYQSSDPNLTLATAIRGDAGFYEDFSSGDNRWQVLYDNPYVQKEITENGQLFLYCPSSSGASSSPEKLSVDLRRISGAKQVGIEFDIKPFSFNSWSGLGFAIGIGSDEWNAEKGTYGNAAWLQLKDGAFEAGGSSGSLTTLKNVANQQTYRIKINLDQEAGTASYYIDGKYYTTVNYLHSGVQGICNVILYHYGNATLYHIDNLVAYEDFTQSQQIIDNAGRVLQTQSEVDNNFHKGVRVSETLYDALGRPAVQTKAVLLTDATLGYKPDFVSSYNWANDIMTGDVVDLHPNDGGYPYTRTVYEQSPRSRALYTTQPGTTFNLASGKYGTVDYSVNEALEMGEGFSAGEYLKTTVTNPDGAQQITFTSKAGQVIMEKVGPVKGNSIVYNEVNHQVNMGESWRFSVATAQTVDIGFMTLEGSITLLEIGTSPGGSEIYSTSQPTLYQFEAEPGVSYYISVTGNSFYNATAFITYYEEEVQENVDIYLTTRYEYDRYGNVTATYPPNYFNPPSTDVDPESYVTRNTYDFFGRVKTHTTPDAGTTRYIYESKTGRVRFMQDARGAASNSVLYTKYDDLGRVTETGYISQAWNESTLQNYADNNDDWPATPATWRKKYYYRGWGDFLSERDALDSIEVNNNYDTEPEVVEKLVYNIDGNVIEKRTNILNYEDTEVAIKYEYNYDGSVASVNYNDATEIEPVTYTYNKDGSLQAIGTETSPHKYASYRYNRNGGLYQESINDDQYTVTYSYESNGWLKRIQSSKFREDLLYTSGGYQNASYYSGLIAQTNFIFNTGFTDANGTNLQTNYKVLFKYDNASRLLTAYNTNSSNFRLGTATPLKYDANGNILTLQRGSTTYNYEYLASTNRLDKVSGSTSQYVYDANGNTVEDLRRDIELYYDPYFNKVMSLRNNVDGSEFMYEYGADGERALKHNEESSGTLWQAYYRGLSDYPLIERTLKDGVESTTYYVYGGNGLIATLSSQQQSLQATGTTLEDGNMPQSLEGEQDGVNTKRGTIIASELFNHTMAPGAKNSLRLSGLPGEQLGLETALPVAAGDIINLEVYAKYPELIEDPQLRQQVLSSGALSLPQEAITNLGELGRLGNQPLAQPGALIPIWLQNEKQQMPKANLNYVLVDGEGNQLDAGFVAVNQQAAEDGSGKPHQRLAIENLKMKENGYLYVYVSNQSVDGQPHDVFFDDLYITQNSTVQTRFVLKDHLGSTRVVLNESNAAVAAYDYLPFGGRMREFNTEEGLAYQYTGQEFDSESGYENYRARLYDSEIGRMLQVDPAEQFHSPFTYAGNNPVMMIDPDGELAWFVPIIIGAVIGGTTGGIAAKSMGYSTFGGIWRGALIGGAAGFAGVGATAAVAGTSITAAGSAGLGAVLAGGAAGGLVNGVGMAGLSSGWNGTAMLNGAWQGALGGAIGAGIGAGVGQIMPMAGGFFDGFARGALGGGVSGGLNAAITGQDIGRGMWQGGAMGGVIGGAFAGIEARKAGATFFTGKATGDIRNGVGAHNIPKNIDPKVKGKYAGRYEGVPVFESTSMGDGGITLPPTGIFVGDGAFSKNQSPLLLQHEFGHWLQYKKYGANIFYRTIGLQSLYSATVNDIEGHRAFWTETWANYLSSEYFGTRYQYNAKYPVENIHWFRKWINEL
jgi:RHS repeat-associated protein